MTQTIITPTEKYLRRSPNLENYDVERKGFDWATARQDLGVSTAKTNLAHHVVSKKVSPEKTALLWYSQTGKLRKFKYRDIEKLSNQFANVLKKEAGVKKGDRVFFFLPRIPEIYYGFLGALKAGAVGGTLFPAFGSQALISRLGNSDAKVVVTNKELLPRIKKVKNKLPNLEKIILVENLPPLLKKASEKTKIVNVKPDDPAFMLYTSATGNTPVCGIVVPHKAFIQQHLTASWVLDLKENDLYWCTADPGWVTGVVYGILTPWSHGVTQIIFEGRFSPEKWLSILAKNKVTVLYTAPTAIRMLVAANEKLLEKYDLSHLRHIASVGEPLNPPLIDWSLKKLRLPIHDTWWQTETGGIMIANYPSLSIKPGSMGKPIPGVEAAIIDEKGKALGPHQEGQLAFKPNWPGMMSQVWKHKKRYQSYFKNGWYLSGDKAKKDEDGYFWFIGRADDVIKTAGERVGPFEVETALMSHPDIAETGVIGKPDPTRGQIIKAFVVLKPGVKKTEALKEKIKQFTKKELAGHAYPREIEFTSGLPKNRSGKIVRRILKARELGLPEGDTSTLIKSNSD